ncbi:MAG: secondary thiamine-phosphate synthase enzyme YjbQ [Gammaproteobacteria bacterium]|nr:secondary thiamine-phosphate synthase enzyme YjbQ [Gammaproteobacteria bacterium]
MSWQTTLAFETRGRGTTDITDDIRRAVRESGITTGICHCFILHTSASLLLTENADPQVRADMEAWMSRAVQDGDPIFGHTEEGPDDMSAHVRTVLTESSLTLPVGEGNLVLGTWQGVFLWEHRTGAQRRKVVITVQ